MNSLQKKKLKGFTLIELMIVVAIIGILAAIAVPKFADLVTKSREASAKASLGSVRSALSIYYGDTEGAYAGDLYAALTTGNKYLPAVAGYSSLGKYILPSNSVGNNGHTGGNFGNANSASAVGSTISEGTASLYYTNTNGDVAIMCTHNDSKGTKWSTF